MSLQRHVAKQQLNLVDGGKQPQCGHFSLPMLFDDVWLSANVIDIMMKKLEMVFTANITAAKIFCFS